MRNAMKMTIQSARQSRAIILLLVLLLLTACASLPGQKQLISPSTYTLQAPDKKISQKVTEKPGCLTLVVSPMRALPGFDTLRMAYVRKDYQLEYFANHRWVDTPARMLTPVLIYTLESSGVFKNIIAAPAPAIAHVRLDSELLSLQQVFRPEGSEIQLSMRIVLFDQVHRGVMASRVFSITEPAHDSPYGGVLAANRAIAQLLPKLVTFLADVSEENSCAHGGDSSNAGQ